MSDFLDDEMEEEYPIITMEDTETGEKTEYMLINSVTDNGNIYWLAIKTEEIDDDDAEAWIFKQGEEVGNEVIYSIVENEAELEGVLYLFNESSEDYDIQY